MDRPFCPWCGEALETPYAMSGCHNGCQSADFLPIPWRATGIILLVIFLAAMGARAAFAAPPAPLNQYKAQMARAQKNVALAEVAYTCGIRSQRWLEVFEDGYQLLATSEARRLGLGSAGLDASDAMVEATTRDARAGLTCSKLANSKTMAKLDTIHHILTAGFQ